MVTRKLAEDEDVAEAIVKEGMGQYFDDRDYANLRAVAIKYVLLGMRWEREAIARIMDKALRETVIPRGKSDDGSTLDAGSQGMPEP